MIGEVAGEKESPVYAILEMRKKIDAIKLPEGYKIKQYTARVPESSERFSIKWDGEWHITYEVFRDLGLAFGWEFAHGHTVARKSKTDLI